MVSAASIISGRSLKRNRFAPGTSTSSLGDVAIVVVSGYCLLALFFLEFCLAASRVDLLNAPPTSTFRSVNFLLLCSKRRLGFCLAGQLANAIYFSRGTDSFNLAKTRDTMG